ncbi:MAG TPA: haloacid dehalogenase type II [Halococcus sp.]|nr:haloacid dehalogenase type II [Halococcus sp.]
MAVSDVDALLFDVFGTVVDWRSGVIRDGEKLGEEHGLGVDWGAFADAWREEYQPSMDRVRDGEIPWKPLDALHRESLENLVEEFGIETLSEEEKDRFNRVWHRLDPWPDSIPGLRRLRTRYLIAPLSNGNVRLLTDMAKRAGIPWDLILSAELAHRYKPHEETYLTSAELLGLTPDRVMMVAAHEMDLDAADDVGFHTAYVHRPLEWGRETDTAEKPDESAYDIVADDLVDLADTLDTYSTDF